MSESQIDVALRTRTIAGGVAGNLTCTGIAVGDKLKAVQRVNAAGADLSSEFSITAADTINNAGGTNTTGMTLLVVWIAKHPLGDRLDRS